MAEQRIKPEESTNFKKMLNEQKKLSNEGDEDAADHGIKKM